MGGTITAETAGRLAVLAAASCGFITGAAWSADGAMLGVSHGAGVWLWAGGFGPEPTARFQPHDGPVKALAFRADGLLATGSADATVALLRAPGGERISTVGGLSSAVDAVAFRADGRELAFGAADGRVRTLRLDGDGAARVLEGHDGPVTGIAYAGPLLASAGRDGTVRLWEEGRARAVLRGHEDWIRALAVAPDGRYAASAGRDATAHLWDVSAGALVRAHALDADSRAVAFSADGALLAVGDGAVVRVFSVADGRPVARLEAHSRPVLALAFHPAGTLLVSGSGDNTVRAWGIAT